MSLKKTDYNAKVSNIESQIAGVNKNSLDNLVEIKVLKTKTVDASNFVTRTKFSTDTNALDDKIDKVDKKIPDISGLATKTSLISNEVKKVDDKAKKNASDISEFENKISFSRDLFLYIAQTYLVYDCKMNSFEFDSGKISMWNSTGIFNYSNDSDMRAVENPKIKLPELKIDGRMYVSVTGNYFEQNKVITPNNNNVINIYCVYELRSVDPPLIIEFTITNALFGAIAITKNTNTSKYKYKRYGICFDKSKIFTHTRKEGNINHTTTARNVIIFGADMSFSKHASNKANNIYVMGQDYVKKINDTTIYADKMFYRKFTEPGKKFVLSLHYNGDNSYLLVNGKEELKFKAKIDLLVPEELCIGSLSNNWSPLESQKTGLCGSIYDFAVDYEEIIGVGPIYDMHRYLMTKHNINS